MLRRTLAFASLWLALTLSVPGAAPAADAAGAADSLTISGLATSEGSTVLREASVELVPIVANFVTLHRTLTGTDADPVARAEVDADGRYRLDAPSAGLYEVRLSAPGRVPVRFAPLAITEATELPPVALPEDIGVRFEIHRQEGAPIPETGVYVTTTEASRRDLSERMGTGWRPVSRSGRTDSAGLVRFPRAAGERVDVSIFFPGAAGPMKTEAVDEGLGLYLDPPAGTTRWLRVQDTAGEPVPGALVATTDLAWPLGVTGEDGRFALRGDLSEPLAIHVLAEDGRRTQLDLAPRPRSTEDTVVILPDTVTLTGRILDDSTRRPLPGALVWGGFDPGTFATTDGTGGFRLAVSPTVKVWIQGEASGFFPRAVTLRPDGFAPEVSAGDVALTAAAGLAGRVVDGAGRPIEGAEIVAFPATNAYAPAAFRPHRADGRAMTDTRGRFTFGRLHPRMTYRVRADKLGYRAAEAEMGGLTAGRVRSDAEVVLLRRRSGFGHVLDESEQPLAGAVVTLRPAGEALPSRSDDGEFSAVSGPDGRFEIEALPAENLHLSARLDGYAPFTVPGLRAPQGDGPVDLGSLILVPGAVLVGRVEDTDGNLLDDASVWALEDGDRRAVSQLEKVRYRKVEPDAISRDGEFSIEDRTEGEILAVLVHHEDHLPQLVPRVRVPNEEPVVVRLTRARALEGRVVDDRDEPVAGATVTVAVADDDPGVIAPRAHAGAVDVTATTDGEGRFRLAGLAPNNWLVSAEADGFQPSQGQPVVVAAEGDDPDPVEIRLEPGSVLTGFIRRADGEPAAGARVLVGPVGTRAEEDGRYRLDGVAPGRQVVEGKHPEHRRLLEEVEIHDGENTLDLTFAPGRRVAGRVVDATGVPVASAEVLLDATDAFDPRRYRTLTQETGDFELPAVEDGTYSIRTSHRDYLPDDREAALQVAGAPREGLEIVLSRGARATGFVVGLDPEELGAVRVGAVSSTGAIHRGEVSYDGRYEITTLPPDTYTLRAVLPGGSRQAEARARLLPGVEVVERDLEFGGQLALSGRILGNGQPLAGSRVILAGQNLVADRQTWSDPGGEFTLENLRPGRYRLTVSHPEELMTSNRDLELETDDYVTLDLRTSQVSGRVVSANDGGPVEDALVVLQQLLPDGAEREASIFTLGTNGDGGFRFERLPEGPYSLSVRRDGFADHRAEIEVRSPVSDPLDISLEPTAGLSLAVQLAAGGVPPHVTLALLDGDGRTILSESRRVGPNGVVTFPTAPAGSWEALVNAPGGATERLAVTAPGEGPLPVTLGLPGTLRVEIPGLSESFELGSLTLVDPQGRPFVGLDEASGRPRSAWPVVGGLVQISGLLPGEWQVRVGTPGGQEWTEPAGIAAGAVTEVRLE